MNPHLRRIQEIAPTEHGGAFHARICRELDTASHIGNVVVEPLMGDPLGVAHIGDGAAVARVIVMDDGLGKSGAPVYRPEILVIPEVRKLV